MQASWILPRGSGGRAGKTGGPWESGTKDNWKWGARGRVAKGEGRASATPECSDDALFLELQVRILAYPWPSQGPGSLCGLLGPVLAPDSGSLELCPTHSWTENWPTGSFFGLPFHYPLPGAEPSLLWTLSGSRSPTRPGQERLLSSGPRGVSAG